MGAGAVAELCSGEPGPNCLVLQPFPPPLGGFPGLLEDQLQPADPLRLPFTPSAEQPKAAVKVQTLLPPPLPSPTEAAMSSRKAATCGAGGPAPLGLEASSPSWDMEAGPEGAGRLEALAQACNCSRYLKVSKEEMALLREQSGCWTGEDAEACLGEPGPPATLEPQSGSLGLHQPARSPPWQGPEVAGPGDEPALLPAGVRLKVEAVPPGVLCQEDPVCFYCCSQCGQVFWEGSHLGRLVSQFREVLELPEES